MKLTLLPLLLSGFSLSLLAAEKAPQAAPASAPAEKDVYHLHLQHPGGPSIPGDPNAAYFLDGVYHLHYIVRGRWEGKDGFGFIHVTSPDMLHWTWQKTTLMPAFTGHGMFSGTGFLTKEGVPAVIYHGQGSGKNWIALAKDRALSGWEKPFPVEVQNADGSPAKVRHWDPDCFVIGDTYYAYSGGGEQPLFKSKDLKQWTQVGPLLSRDMPDVTIGEDISCGNFFPLGNKWMLLCISHNLGCRYYLGDWDSKSERFVPERHGRMNWRREDQTVFGRKQWRVDYFAPESLLTGDGRRVMWAWLATIGSTDGAMDKRSIQSLPRELSVGEDGALRIKPIRELEGLREEPQSRRDVVLKEVLQDLLLEKAPKGTVIATLPGEAAEVEVTVDRSEAERKLFGLTLFSDGNGGGMPILFRPETGTIRVGTTEAPFKVTDLAAGEEVRLRVFVDKNLVEVFVNDRQAVVASVADTRGVREVSAFTVGVQTKLKSVQVWKLRPTNAGFREAQENRVWEMANP
ncbi:MAG: Sucrose-6-phosphate hydrolase [Verrucomicrobiota bacterium]|jgi:beta-fructofuranosidase